MKRISLNISAWLVVLTALVFATGAHAGEDKGTIGIALICRDARGNTYEITPDLKGEARERAIREYHACAKDAIRRSTNSEIGVATLMDEARDGGIDPVVLKEAYTIYRNAVDEVKAEERQKAQKKKAQQTTDGGVTSTKKRR